MPASAKVVPLSWAVVMIAFTAHLGRCEGAVDVSHDHNQRPTRWLPTISDEVLDQIVGYETVESDLLGVDDNLRAVAKEGPTRKQNQIDHFLRSIRDSSSPKSRRDTERDHYLRTLKRSRTADKAGTPSVTRDHYLRSLRSALLKDPVHVRSSSMATHKFWVTLDQCLLRTTADF